MTDEDRWTEDDICRGCGQHVSKHSIDQMSLEYQCPVLRQEKHTPPQEHNTSPRGDY